MYNPKFDYKPVPRVVVEGRRFYATPDGNKLPSVTTILDKTKTEESKAALNAWRARMGAERAQQITTEAANRGTRMHTYLEHYVKTGTRKERGSNPFSWPSHVMAEEIINRGLVNVSEVWAMEEMLYFPKQYAGTADLIGLHNGEPAIMDYKTTNKMKSKDKINNYACQLAAYALAHNEIFGTQIKRGVIFMVARDLSFQEYVFEGEEFTKATDEWLARLDQFFNQPPATPEQP